MDADRRGDGGAGVLLALRQDGILKIEDEDVGRDRAALVEAAIVRTRYIKGAPPWAQACRHQGTPDPAKH
jgi:hypothetical protein